MSKNLIKIVLLLDSITHSKTLINSIWALNICQEETYSSTLTSLKPSQRHKLVKNQVLNFRVFCSMYNNWS